MIESYKGRMITHSTPVFAYRNLHKDRWSLRAEAGPHKGKVIGHTDDVTLMDCTLKVSEAGRQRVIAEKKKNVHAGVVGHVVPEDFDPRNYGHLPTKVSYNPYQAPTFTANGEAVGYATMVHLADDGKAYGYGVLR
ncbi:hypothetical protein M041_gp07 [Mycobacterium phage Severus]|uniref:hypothetical protein n=1 Tax=Mycobacterium phage Severus TaxID=1327776 RepID=UPI00032B6A03|nr:hypothetical protein M041_gp07 [Mycobacterium phage Severus]AVO22477.1 hypothetical protein SEA_KITTENMITTENS_77 [Mycobacterium phage KittenMittens]QWS69363.1 hypothetical protein SEA_PEACEMEAL1_79 [Mycobacterium Phage PeaceMeal1]QZD97063.1 hypothetical protein SEA_DRAKE94_79 [Mycobacterium phage Drake94]USL89209.1 hypothetical protein SEA_POOMPHA_79 [Mycobacterium phage Poompha]AGK88012.1 hypothetical protein PBI_SEVERUS_80 [Mycobacterium phage Severus]